MTEPDKTMLLFYETFFVFFFLSFQPALNFTLLRFVRAFFTVFPLSKKTKFDSFTSATLCWFDESVFNEIFYYVHLILEIIYPLLLNCG